MAGMQTMNGERLLTHALAGIENRTIVRAMTNALSLEQQEALLTVCVCAAFADGSKSEQERAEIKRVADDLVSPELSTASIYRRVLLGPVDLAVVAAPLANPGLRELAYEMAVGVCDADDVTSEAEREFLARLASALGVEAAQAEAAEQSVAAVALAPVTGDVPLDVTSTPVVEADPRAKEGDALTLKYAILNGALELLPQNLATMAIIPLQMQLVYRVGRLYGVNLDRGHIKEFLAAAGVGLTSQVVEGYARKILGGLVGRSLGKLGRGAVDQAASSAFSFASTYALGKLAQSYYAGGRNLGNMTSMRESFQPLLEKAKSLHGQYAPRIREEAAQLDLGKVLASVRGA